MSLRFVGYLISLLLFAGCLNSTGYTVKGTVVELMDDGRVMVDHEEIEGFMDAMTMPFNVAHPKLLKDVKVGDRVVAYLVVSDGKAELTKLSVTASVSVSDVADDKSPPPVGPAPIRIGEVHPAFTVTLSDGTSTVVGKGQGRPTAITYIYTTCPMPEFCPAIMTRLQSLQPLLDGSDARILAVTIDPKVDTQEVLADFGQLYKVNRSNWSLGRATGDDLKSLTGLAGMSLGRQDGQVIHAKRLLVLSSDGELIERYDDANWPIERVAGQLKDGKPLGPPNSSGTLTPKK